jgi:hypothetical protein
MVIAVLSARASNTTQQTCACKHHALDDTAAAAAASSSTRYTHSITQQHGAHLHKGHALDGEQDLEEAVHVLPRYILGQVLAFVEERKETLISMQIKLWMVSKFLTRSYFMLQQAESLHLKQSFL